MTRARRVVLALAALAPALALACSQPPQQPAATAPGDSAPTPGPGALSANNAPAVASSSADNAGPPPLASASAPSVAAPSAAAAGSAAAPPKQAPEGMALVPAGTFVMGSDKLGELDERPAHKVTLRAFYLDLTEVTNEAYQRCVDKGVCRPHDKTNARVNKVGDDKLFRRPKQPISAVSWDDAKAYCGFVGKRLPTEAEFERASRGDDGRTYPWGEAFPTREHSVFGEGTTADVGTRPKGDGPYGHHDLTGNVWEWVEDLYDPYAYKREGAARGEPGTCEQIKETLDELRRNNMQGFTGTNPIPTECERVLRGGAFNYHAKGLRSSNRVHHPGRFRLVMSGFRCALDAG